MIFFIKKIVFLFSILLSLNIFAQDCYYGFGYFCVGESYYVYADAANVRSSPDIKSEAKFLLYAGQEVKVTAIKESQNTQVIDGLEGTWLFVSTNDKRDGWIWSNTLSYKQLRRYNTKFVFAIDKKTEDGYNCILKVVDNGKIVNKLNFKIGFEETLNPDANIIDNVFLENVNYVIHIEIGGGACGFVKNDFYFAWLDANKKLIEFPKAQSVSEACLFSYSEMIVIPNKNQGGIYNLIIKNSEEMTAPDEEDNDCDSSKWSHKYKTIQYKWNGKEVTEITSQ